MARRFSEPAGTGYADTQCSTAIAAAGEHARVQRAPTSVRSLMPVEITIGRPVGADLRDQA